MRWCNEKDYFEGNGRTIRENTSCERKEELKPYELNMSYIKESESKNALVKVLLCAKCGHRLVILTTSSNAKEEEKRKRRKYINII